MSTASSTTGPAIVWLRDDLRIADNPALDAAVAHGGPVVVLYLLDEVSPGIRALGGASRWTNMMWLEFLFDRIGGSQVFAAIADGQPNAWSDPAALDGLTKVQDLVKANGFINGFSSITADSGRTQPSSSRTGTRPAGGFFAMIQAGRSSRSIATDS